MRFEKKNQTSYYYLGKLWGTTYTFTNFLVRYIVFHGVFNTELCHTETYVGSSGWLRGSSVDW
jgi:hypothetical protein